MDSTLKQKNVVPISNNGTINIKIFNLKIFHTGPTYT